MTAAGPGDGGATKGPRIKPLAPSEGGDDTRRLLDATLPGAERPLGELNLFPTFARHPALFRDWLRLGGRLLDGLLPARDRELLILRTAFRTRCGYEWDHHVRIGRGSGLDAGEIDRVVAGPEAGGWDPHDAALLRLVDELHDSADVTDATWAQLVLRYGDAEMLEAIFVVGQYQMLAFALNGARVERDAPRDGAALSDLPW